MAALIYCFLSFFCGIGAMFHTSVATGLIIWGGSWLSVVATGGAIYGARSRSGLGKLISIAFLGVTLCVAYWLSTKFSIGVFGYSITGLVWCLIGCAIGAWWGLTDRVVPKALSGL